ncbi:polyprenol monophosphomannose synthase [Treponema sp. C6A8]|uniref:polyprenol monophosphomannose synthase n=1 Tax=Treponema sp. C6A8 TaxID=1410609 RepID=UPI000489A195|nr:polyprenol monophosphomannose synthase [Treponema sp. C6A8]
MKLLVIMATYNEIENINEIVPAILMNIPENAELLVIDDSSPDGTADAVRKLQEQYPNKINLLVRPGKQGVATAAILGYKWGMERDFDVFCNIDADFSHKPEYLPELYKNIQEYDIVVGSRNVRGGGIENRSFIRNFLTAGGSLYSRLVLGVPVKDFTGGYNMYRKSALEKIGLDNIKGLGYAFQIEMKTRAYKSGCKIKEIPIIFPDRVKGVSKIEKGIFFEALKIVWKIKKDVKETF